MSRAEFTGCAWSAVEGGVMHADGIERRVLPVLAVAHAHFNSTRTHKNAVLEEFILLS